MGTLFDLIKPKLSQVYTFSSLTIAYLQMKNIQNEYGNLFNFNFTDITIEHVCTMAI